MRAETLWRSVSEHFRDLYFEVRICQNIGNAGLDVLGNASVVTSPPAVYGNFIFKYKKHTKRFEMKYCYGKYQNLKAVLLMRVPCLLKV